jgi:hypothetical protein
MDLSELPTDVIPYISAHLTDSTNLNESLRSRRSDTYLLYFFFIKIFPGMQNSTIYLWMMKQNIITIMILHHHHASLLIQQ